MATSKEMYKQAEQLYASGKLQEAVDQLEALVAADDKHVLSRLALAKWLGKLGRQEDGIKHAIKACELQPDDAFNFTALSVTYQQAFEVSRNYDYIRLAEEAKARAQMIQGHHHH
jgi:tetratricopeptide (TPR) repeat protein